ncbi:MAG TPA: (d)CMP kinase [Candidatus Monoglobus merdigallinarum]|uniref:Cytidylate kinase n=1 Tax=Candidatus Monoglobus merdigallinarum TaxID=2838698 RepID=A0A9D1PQ60_9FIRM|nr:(d)CMP kinase [Candidatus Monoglobus merdigallinarum]
MKIAIDGPAGAGKSTISKAVAGELNYLYIDTGAMYRSVGLAAVEAGINTRSETELAGIIGDILIDIKNTEDGQKYYLNGRDVTQKIREPQISMAASDVAVIPAVRLKLVELQRKLAEKTDVVMDGRDIGTYVLRDAELKIFLTASVDERARRRYNELRQKNSEADLDAVRAEMIKRDKNDSEREFAPLRQAEDAVLVDTTNMDIGEVIDKILQLAKEKKNVTL